MAREAICASTDAASVVRAASRDSMAMMLRLLLAISTLRGYISGAEATRARADLRVGKDAMFLMRIYVLWRMATIIYDGYSLDCLCANANRPRRDRAIFDIAR